MSSHSKNGIDRITFAGFLITLGIVFGDIGTSPLYVLRAITGSGVIDEDVTLGALSCVFWTLTLQTTVKYVWLILKADNKGEGGILSLYTLVRRHNYWLIVPAIFGASTLLADSIITPPFTVASAVEGIISYYPDFKIIPTVTVILTILFLFQIFGTDLVGKSFGPVMVLWFGTLAVLGLLFMLKELSVLKALNPVYAYKLLVQRPGGFYLLGAVFLCTTGAEALYSDMGHVGRGNIRISWIFVKASLLLNYFGQGAYLISLKGTELGNKNPFYDIMPAWFLPFGIALATAAAIIASQSLITGAYTLIAEAIRLNFWPKVKVNYPSTQKGQIYIPSANIMMYLGCIALLLYFGTVADHETMATGKQVLVSSTMEHAYGLAIVLTMIMTTVLFMFYLRKVIHRLLWCTFLFIEFCFFFANIEKFAHGGWVPLVMATMLSSIMFIWYSASKIKARLTEFTKIDAHLTDLKELSCDDTIPKYATHLAFLSNATRSSEIESKIIYSIFQKRPKRADIYWFIHIDNCEDPYTMEYKVQTIAPDDVYKVTFKLGFKVPQKINLYFKEVLESMVETGEVDIRSRYESLNKMNVTGDIRFVVLEKFLSFDNDLSFFDNVVMKTYFFFKGFTPTEDKWFGLDTSSVKVEKVPMVIKKATAVQQLKRVPWN